MNHQTKVLCHATGDLSQSPENLFRGKVDSMSIINKCWLREARNLNNPFWELVLVFHTLHTYDFL